MRDWSDECWVKLYRRDEPEWSCLPIVARGLFYELMRKVDRCGICRVGRSPEKSLAATCHMTLDETRVALPLLLEDGCIRISDGILTIPNFLEAQEAKQSDRARQAKRREIRRASQDVTVEPRGVMYESQDVSEASRSVTRESRDVTPSHEEKRREEKRTEERTPSLVPPVLSETEPAPEKNLEKSLGKKRKQPRTVRHLLPEDWLPSPEHYQQAQTEAGRDVAWVDEQATRMRDWTSANGKRYVDWDAMFRNWLRRASEEKPHNGGNGGRGPVLEPPKPGGWQPIVVSAPTKAELAEQARLAEERKRADAQKALEEIGVRRLQR